MDLRMTDDEREAFLADLHVGVMAIERADGPPLAVPIWYAYQPGGELDVLTGLDSLKARLVQAAGRFSLCAQDETHGAYKYVTVEGPVQATVAADVEADSRPMARRYLGTEFGDAYIAAGNGEGSLKVTMRPERWFSVDYTKLF